MPSTVIGLFRNETDVQHVVDELQRNDFPARDVKRRDEVGADLGGWLEEQGVPGHEAEDYVEGVRKGGKLVTLHVSDDRAPEAVQIMRRHETAAADLGGATAGGTAARGDRTAHDDHAGRTRGEGEETLEVTEEEVDVGTREVERGGVRARTYVKEEPVEKDVRVRDESVHVDRRPVDRAVTDTDDAFREKSVEMTETDEEPVVRKRARVIEEVVLSKDVDEHTETVRDTVRKTDVDVEGEAGGYTFDDDRDHFRAHHRENFADRNYDYEDYEPAYRYGTSLAEHPSYRDRTWADVAPEAREHWERRNPGTWNDFEPAAGYGYERALARSRR